MRKESYVIDGVTYIRISKATARKLFDDGNVIGICPVELLGRYVYVSERPQVRKLGL